MAGSTRSASNAVAIFRCSSGRRGMPRRMARSCCSRVAGPFFSSRSLTGSRQSMYAIHQLQLTSTRKLRCRWVNPPDLQKPNTVERLAKPRRLVSLRIRDVSTTNPMLGGAALIFLGLCRSDCATGILVTMSRNLLLQPACSLLVARHVSAAHDLAAVRQWQ